jgi:hypothetical protein
MNKKAQEIWEVFCNELAGEPTDDQREALATALRKVVNELQCYECPNDFGVVRSVISAITVYDLADELEKL